MSKPVFLFAFANDKDAYLENLKEEERVAREIFSRLHDQGVIEFLSIGSTNSEDIFRNVERFLDRLTLFHYGGHAAGTQLYLEDGIASSQGLSKLLGQAKSLQTVVLNGCSSRGQTEKLFQSGVKSVIATSAPIDDDKAVLFAKELYRSFSSGSTLEAAFEIAAAALQTHGKLKNKEISKKVGSAEELAKEEILWGLYSRTRSVLGWKLRDVPELKKT